ncbi:MAG: hypothetical protein HXS44_12060 [Theionarchaea archaeon]|nr:hypothetical protein [Theionarchaea archaeon]
MNDKTRKKRISKTTAILLLAIGGLLSLTPGIVTEGLSCEHLQSCTSCGSEKRASLTGAADGNELCSTLTISSGEKVLFGGNVDSALENYSESAPYIMFFPPSEKDAYEYGYGFMVIGWEWEDLSTRYSFSPCGMNEKGLAFSRNGLPKAALNPHPEKPYSSFRSFYTKVMRDCSSIDCVIEMAQTFDWGTSMSMQMHFADASGAAVIISAGKDGELVFTRKDLHYLVSTNFNRTNPENGEYPCWRYDTAMEMLENSEDYTIDYVASILDAIHVEGICVNTRFSYIFDLCTGDGHVYYFHQFDDVVEFNVGTGLVETAEGAITEYYAFEGLFSQKTLDEASSALREYQEWKIILRMGIGSAAFLGFGLLVYRKVRIRRSEFST